MGRAGAKKNQDSTPLMRQYREAKQAYPDAIMLFRMGDFYETFEDDAKIAASVLSITLTKRSNKGRSESDGPAVDIPLAGFPYHALDAYLHKLLKAGYKVAICEQVEDPKKAVGLVKRAVTEVVTPGTAMTERFLEADQNNYLASVVRAGDQAGIAFLDSSTGEFFLEELALKSMPERLMHYRPSEIIVPESQLSYISPMIQSTGCMVSTFPDWVASLDNAQAELLKHFHVRSLKGFGLETCTVGLSAAGAIIRYVYQNLPGSKPHIAALRSITGSEYLGLDNFTVRNLELFSSLATQGTHGTLINILDRTRTAAGARLLKQWLRMPLKDIAALEGRLDRVAEFHAQHDLRQSIRDILRSIADITRILGRVSTRRSNPREIRQLAASLATAYEIAGLISKAAAPALGRLCDYLRDVHALIEQISTTLVDEPPMNAAKGGFIRAGVNSQLDELTRLATSGKDWIVELQLSERKKTGIPSLRVGYNNVFGYYLEITKTHQDKVPEHYIRKQTLVNAERYITPDLKEYEEKILTAEEKSLEIEKELLEQLQLDILDQSAHIQENAHTLAMLDVAASLAEVADRGGYCRPVLAPEPGLAIIGSRHPVVETLLPMGEQFTPNDLVMKPGENQIHLITGPNMAGKSTYLRQIGLIVVLAQMGSFVSAESATLGITDRVFTRVGASDNLAGGESTFLVEMVETANILNNAGEHSLVLLDEIGRGTSTYDGLSIAWAVIEYLHQSESVRPMTLFATHYHELLVLADSLPRVRNFNVAVKEHGQEVVFLRKIIPGGADRSYGIYVAQMAGLPAPVIKRAGELLELLSAERKPTPAQMPAPDFKQISLFTPQEEALRKELKEIVPENLTPLEALNLLDKLKKKHGQ